jgi:hypothetical protein
MRRQRLSFILGVVGGAPLSVTLGDFTCLMQIEAFCLCKAAPVNEKNQPSLLDIFDKKIAAGEPALIDSFVVALSIRFYRQDEGRHTFSIALKNREGKTLRPAIVEVIAVSQLPDDSLAFFHTYQVPSLPWNFGTYEFTVETRGVLLARTPLYVVPGRV